jgi:hypothetical protein
MVVSFHFSNLSFLTHSFDFSQTLSLLLLLQVCLSALMLWRHNGEHIHPHRLMPLSIKLAKHRYMAINILRFMAYLPLEWLIHDF